MNSYTGISLLSGNANLDLAEAIASDLNITLCKRSLIKFNDGEISAQIQENVRGKDLFIIQSVCPPDINDALMELLILIDAAKRASARRVTAVIPYYGYARQDRKDRPRVPITAKLVANLITKAGVDRVLTMDLHCGQIQGFFDIPMDHLFAAPVLVDYIQNNWSKPNTDDMVVVAPDTGSVKLARAYSKFISGSLAIIDKRRERAGVAEAMNVIGNVEGKSAILMDDMIDTGGTIAEASKALIKCGVTEVYACCTHAVFSGTAAEKLASSDLKEILITDTIPNRSPHPKIKVVSVSGLLADAITRIHDETSISTLFVPTRI